MMDFSTYGIIISGSAYPKRYVLRISIRHEMENEELNVSFKSVIVALREKEILQICRASLRLLSVIRSYKAIRPSFPRVSRSETSWYGKQSRNAEIKYFIDFNAAPLPRSTEDVYHLLSSRTFSILSRSRERGAHQLMEMAIECWKWYRSKYSAAAPTKKDDGRRQIEREEGGKGKKAIALYLHRREIM